MEIDFLAIKKEKYIIIDLRDKEEFKKRHLDDSINIPFTQFLIDYEKYLSKEENYLLVCTYGIKSKNTSIILNKKGYHTFSLKGGIKMLLKRKV